MYIVKFLTVHYNFEIFFYWKVKYKKDFLKYNSWQMLYSYDTVKWPTGSNTFMISDIQDLCETSTFMSYLQ